MLAVPAAWRITLRRLRKACRYLQRYTLHSQSTKFIQNLKTEQQGGLALILPRKLMCCQQQAEELNQACSYCKKIKKLGRIRNQAAASLSGPLVLVIFHDVMVMLHSVGTLKNYRCAHTDKQSHLCLLVRRHRVAPRIGLGKWHCLSKPYERCLNFFLGCLTISEKSAARRTSFR